MEVIKGIAWSLGFVLLTGLALKATDWLSDRFVDWMRERQRVKHETLPPQRLARYDLPDELATRRPPKYDPPPISISGREARKPFKGDGAA